MTLVFFVLLVSYAALTGVRIAAALIFLTRARVQAGDARDLTILQPILSGDPALEGCLAANLAATPETRFIWLIDENDAEGRRIGEKLKRANVTIMLGPPPADGENPKVAKLARALPQVTTAHFAVLDDDTMLPPGGAAEAIGALRDGDLATGLPLYVNRATIWSRLVTAFVNGAALITYPPGALMGAQRTINGMFYVGRTDDLRALGGFDAIRTTLTDDYAMAKLYLNAGKRLVQTRVVHPISTTVESAARYWGIMRRWMIFAARYVRENVSLFTLLVIGAPTFLPLVLLVSALFAGLDALLWLGCALFAKAALTAALRRALADEPIRALDIAFEIAADLLTPIHYVRAALSSRRFQWRSRAMRMDGETIRYE